MLTFSGLVASATTVSSFCNIRFSSAVTSTGRICASTAQEADVDKPVVPLEYQEGAASARGRRATSKLRTFLREPLVHFLFLGALLFIIFAFVGKNVSLAPPPQKPQIIVAPDRVTQLIN